MKFKKGDLVKVTSASAPYHGYTGTVDEMDQGDPFPVVVRLTIDNEGYPVSYREFEVETVDADAATQEIPVVIG